MEPIPLSQTYKEFCTEILLHYTKIEDVKAQTSADQIRHQYPTHNAVTYIDLARDTIILEADVGYRQTLFDIGTSFPAFPRNNSGK